MSGTATDASGFAQGAPTSSDCFEATAENRDSAPRSDGSSEIPSLRGSLINDSVISGHKMWCLRVAPNVFGIIRTRLQQIIICHGDPLNRCAGPAVDVAGRAPSTVSIHAVPHARFPICGVNRSSRTTGRQHRNQPPAAAGGVGHHDALPRHLLSPGLQVLPAGMTS